MEFSIFSDLELTQEIDNNILFESHSYFIKFSNKSYKEIDRFLREYNLSNIISIIPGNNVGIISLVNQVGQLNIGIKYFDVRTHKLFPDKLGKEQFQLLLDEVNSLSKGLTFDYNSPTTSNYLEDFSDPAPHLIERFNYYRQIVFNKEVQFLIDLCFLNLNSKREYKFEKVSIFSSNYLSGQELKSALRYPEFGRVEGSAYKEIGLTKLIKETTSKDFIPLYVQKRKTDFTKDTSENQFLKYFLEDIKNICIHVIREHKGRVSEDAKFVLNVVNRILSKPEFRLISRLQHLPLNSQVLQKRAGYREIFKHYLLSKIGHKTIIDDLTSIKSPLKNIATLYEIWILYKIASVLFPSKITSKTNRIFKDNSLKYQIIWSDEKYELGYNLTYSRTNSINKTYSVSLRPDYTILNKHNNQIYIFDAKFKSQIIESDLMSRQFKNEDIYKMHTYLDAIPKAISAVEIYPGSEFAFFDKLTFQKLINLDEIIAFNGVGAVPAIPTNTSCLENFLKLL